MHVTPLVSFLLVITSVLADENATFALGGFRDPSAPLIECDETWSYREQGGEGFDEVFPDPVDNCLPIDTYVPFYKPDPPPLVDFEANSPTVTAAVPEGYEILPGRWCSIKQNPDVCGSGANILYRPDAANAQGTCTVGEVRRGWAYCVRAVDPGATPEPTTPPVSTPGPTIDAQLYPRAVQGFVPVGVDGGGVACDRDWSFRTETGETLIPSNVDGCLSLTDPLTQPFRWTEPDLPPNATAVSSTPNVTEVVYTRWCSVKQNLYGTGNNYYTNLTTTTSGTATGPGQLMRAWGYCLREVVTNSPTPYPTEFPTEPPVPTTGQPTDQPNEAPTGQPTGQPTDQPSTAPTLRLTTEPTKSPTPMPTINHYDIAIYSILGVIGLVVVTTLALYAI